MLTEEAWEYLIENGIATEEELQLVTNLNGYTLETLDDVCYYRTGEHLPEDEEEWEEENECPGHYFTETDGITGYDFCDGGCI